MRRGSVLTLWVEFCPAGLETDASRCPKRKRFRVKPVFDGQYPCGERIRRVVDMNGHAVLRDNRALVHAFGHEMHRTTGDPHPGIERALMRVQTRKQRQD